MPFCCEPCPGNTYTFITELRSSAARAATPHRIDHRLDGHPFPRLGKRHPHAEVLFDPQDDPDLREGVPVAELERRVVRRERQRRAVQRLTHDLLDPLQDHVVRHLFHHRFLSPTCVSGASSCARHRSSSSAGSFKWISTPAASPPGAGTMCTRRGKLSFSGGPYQIGLPAPRSIS